MTSPNSDNPSLANELTHETPQHKEEKPQETSQVWGPQGPCYAYQLIPPKINKSNLKMMGLVQMFFPFQGGILRFHVNLPGCNPPENQDDNKTSTIWTCIFLNMYFLMNMLLFQPVTLVSGEGLSKVKVETPRQVKTLQNLSKNEQQLKPLQIGRTPKKAKILVFQHQFFRGLSALLLHLPCKTLPWLPEPIPACSSNSQRGDTTPHWHQETQQHLAKGNGKENTTWKMSVEMGEHLPKFLSKTYTIFETSTK